MHLSIIYQIHNNYPFSCSFSATPQVCRLTKILIRKLQDLALFELYSIASSVISWHRTVLVKRWWRPQRRRQVPGPIMHLLWELILWEHARLCSLSRDNLPAPTGGRLHLCVRPPGSPATLAGVVLRHTWLHTQCKRMVTGTGGTVGVCRYAPGETG